MSDDVPERPLPDLAAIEADLDAVGRVLTRLDEGSYGRCEVCGEAITAADIDENPLVERCEIHRFDDRADDVPSQTAWGSGGVASN